MRNHIVYKFMVSGPIFYQPIIFHKVSKYINKYGPNPKVEPIDLKTNPQITQNCYKHASHSVKTKIKCTETSSKYQKQYLYYLLYYLYMNASNRHENPPILTPCSPCVTNENDDTINTFLSPE